MNASDLIAGSEDRDAAERLTPAGCRAARAILGWGVRDLALAAGVTPHTISEYERGRPMRTSTKARLAAAIERQGVQLLRRGGHGARLYRRGSPSAGEREGRPKKTRVLSAPRRP